MLPLKGNALRYILRARETSGEGLQEGETARLYVIANMANIEALQGNIKQKSSPTTVIFGAGAIRLQADWKIPLASVRDQLLMAGYDFDVHAGLARANKRFSNFARSAFGVSSDPFPGTPDGESQRAH